MVVVVLVCIYLLGIVSQLLVKPGSSRGQLSVSMAEVEKEVSEAAIEQRAHVSSTRCKESPRNHWHCTIRLTNGHYASGSATWYQSQDVLGVYVQLGSR